MIDFSVQDFSLFKTSPCSRLLSVQDFSLFKTSLPKTSLLKNNLLKPTEPSSVVSVSMLFDQLSISCRSVVNQLSISCRSVVNSISVARYSWPETRLHKRDTVRQWPTCRVANTRDRIRSVPPFRWVVADGVVLVLVAVAEQ
jgi:hypothetical protein